MNLDNLIKPVSVESPCGEDLYYEQSYNSILDADIEYITGDSSAGMFDSDKEDGDSGGDWGSISRRAIEYFSLTKHLGLVYYLTAGEVNTQGLLGLRDGFILYRILLTSFWDNIHPLPDDGDLDDRMDEIEMINDSTICSSLLNVTVAEGRLGKVSFRNVIESKSSRPELIDKVTDAVNISLQRDAQHFDKIALEISEIEKEMKTFTEGVWTKYFTDKDVDLESLKGTIKELKKALQLIELGEVAEVESNMNESENAVANLQSAPIQGEIQSREDVKNTIDKIIRFYSKNEPTSPVPGLLKRAKRMVVMDFMEIVKEFGLDQSRFESNQIFGESENE